MFKQEPQTLDKRVFMPPKTTFGERFAWIFEHRGTNPSRLAKDAGLSRSHIRDWIKEEAAGKPISPTLGTLEAIARAGSVSVAWLMSGEGSPEESPQPASATVVRDEAPPGGVRQFGDLPGWAEAEAEAQRLYGQLLPPSSWAAAREMRGAQWPKEITARTVYRFAKAWFEQSSEEELILREREEIARQIAAYRATDEAKRRGHG